MDVLTSILIWILVGVLAYGIGHHPRTSHRKSHDEDTWENEGGAVR